MSRLSASPYSVLLLLLCIFRATTATEIYVSPSGSDDQSGDQNNPVFTLNAAIAKSATGGTVYVLSGTYEYLSSQILDQTMSLTFVGVGQPKLTCLVTGQFTLKATNTVGSYTFQGIDFGDTAMNSRAISLENAASFQISNATITTPGGTPVYAYASKFIAVNATITGGSPIQLHASVPGSMFQSSTIKGFEVPSNGGALAVFQPGHVLFEDCAFLDNAAGHGAVFYHSDTDLTIRRSTFANNAGTSPGGHVRAPLDFSGGIVIIDSCNFTYNYASLGGAVFVYDTDLRITNSSFENNMGLVAGGAIFANGNSTVTLTYSKFRGNRALTGGVVYANVASVKVSFSEFTLNLASDAGVIFAQNSTIEVGNTDFLGNTADPGVGGAIASTGSSILTIANDTYFVANTANYGGAIFIEKSATISMLRILFSLCSAKQGGGAIYASTNVLVDLNRVYMFDSSALNLHGGGVLAVRGSRVRIQSSVFEGSVAREGGAGIHADELTSFEVFDSIFSKSVAQMGGGVLIANASVVMRNVIFRSNSAVEGGGAVAFVSGTQTQLFKDCTFINGTADGGAGIYSRGGLLMISGGEFRDNLANAGADLSVAKAYLSISDVYFGNCRAGHACIYLNGSWTQSFSFVNSTLENSQVDEMSSGSIYITSATTTISNSTLKGNQVPLGSSLRVVDPIGTTTITDSVFDGNRGRIGGAALIFGSTTMSKVKIINNLASYSGGGILVSALGITETVNVTDCEFRGNIMEDHSSEQSSYVGGGGLLIEGDCTAVIDNCIFDSNQALYPEPNPGDPSNDVRGGGFYFVRHQSGNGHVTLRSSIFTNNIAFGFEPSGGGAAIAAGTVIVDNVDFINNTCFGFVPRDVANGGGLYTEALSTTITNTRFTRNSAKQGGGWNAIAHPSGFAAVRGSEFVENSARSMGGAMVLIYLEATFEGCQFLGNRGGIVGHNGYGPAVAQFSDSSVTFQRSTFTNNVPAAGVFSSEMAVESDSYIEFLPDPTDPPIINLPSFFWTDKGTIRIDQLQRPTRLGSIKMWYSPHMTTRGEFFIGEHDVQASERCFFSKYDGRFLLENSFMSDGIPFRSTITSLGGNLHINASAEIVRAEAEANAEFVLNNVHLYIARTAFFDPTTTYLNNSGITASLVRFLTFLEHKLYGTGTQKRSTVNAEIVYCAGLTFVDVDFTVTTELLLLISNYWVPGWISMNATSTAKLRGEFYLVSDLLRDYTEPAPFAQMPVIYSHIPIDHDFDRLFASGGYDYQLVFASGNLFAHVELLSFYPITTIADSGNYIIVKYPRETNTPFHNSDCRGILTPDTVTQFGPDLKCVWTRSDELHITSSKLANYYDPIKHLNNVVQDLHNETFAVSGQVVVRVRNPENPPVPVPVVNAPAISQDCSELLLDASATYNGGAYPMTFQWSLVSPTDAVLTAHLLAATTTKVLIPSSLAPARDYRFRLVVTTVFGTTAQIEANVTRLSGAVPLLFVEGPLARNHYVNSILQLSGRAEFADCSSAKGSAITAQWTQISGPSLELPAGNALALFVPAKRMAPGGVYQFEFSGYPKESPQFIGKQVVTITAVGSPMILTASGGGTISAKSGGQLTLKLNDPDESVSNLPVTFYWDALYCPSRGQLDPVSITSTEIASTLKGISASLGGNPDVRLTGVTCRFANGSIYPANFGNFSQVTLPGGDVLLPGAYIFVAAASRGERVADTLIYVDIESSFQSTFTIDIVPAIARKKASVQERLALVGLINNENRIPAGHSVRWRITDPSAAAILQNATNLASTTTNINLVVRPNTLTPGQLYPFELALLDASGNIVAVARQPMIMNSAPDAGIIDVSPATDGKQGDQFVLSGLGWLDDDAPLRYLFTVESSTGSGEIALSDILDVPILHTIMPVMGDPSKGYQLTVRLTILDTMGASKVVETIVQAMPPTRGSSFNSLTLTQQLELALNIGDYRLASQVAVALLASENSAGNQALEIRHSVLNALTVFSNTQPLTLVNSKFLLTSLDILTRVPSGVDAVVRNGALDIIETIVQSVLEGDDITLLTSQSPDSRQAAIELAKGLENMLKSGSFAASDVTDATKSRIITVVIKLAQIQQRNLLVGEDPSQLSGDGTIVVLAQKLTDEQIANGYFTNIGSTTVKFNPGSPSDVYVIIWANGTFPFAPPDGQAPYGTVVTVGGSGGDITFNDVDGTPERCGLFDENTHTWDTSRCLLHQLGDKTWSCTCNGAGSLTLLFDTGFDGLSPGAKAGIAIAVVLVVVAAVGIAIFLKYRLRSPNLESTHQRIADVQMQAMKDDQDVKVRTEARAAQNVWSKANPDQVRVTNV